MVQHFEPFTTIPEQLLLLLQSVVHLLLLLVYIKIV